MPPPRPNAAPRPRSDIRRVAAVLAVIATLIAVPAGIVGGIDWLDLSSGWSGAGRPLPQWVTSGEVRATTRDGTLVKLRVAFDAGSSSTRSAVQRRMRDVGLLLEVSIGAHSTPELAGAPGITRLSQDMLRRVNDFLGSEGVAPVKSVAIQDFWFTRP
jgi:hypothetical protein